MDFPLHDRFEESHSNTSCTFYCIKYLISIKFLWLMSWKESVSLSPLVLLLSKLRVFTPLPRNIAIYCTKALPALRNGAISYWFLREFYFKRNSPQKKDLGGALCFKWKTYLYYGRFNWCLMSYSVPYHLVGFFHSFVYEYNIINVQPNTI